MLGLLFRIEYAIRMGIALGTRSCTSMPCGWNDPGQEENTDPIILSEQKWTKQQYFGEGKELQTLCYNMHHLFLMGCTLNIKPKIHGH